MIDDGAVSAGAVSLVLFGVVLALALSSVQAFISANVGSDHPVHVFLTRNIRTGGFRLFVRIPRLLNTCYCAALPQYLHWIVAHFRPSAVYWGERLLNPSVNALYVLVFAALALLAEQAQGLPASYVGLGACFFALTPQFYHALSARNFGLSSRGIGLVLFTLYLLVAFLIASHTLGPLGWCALAVLGWLIFGFNTFAVQALFLISALLLVIAGQWIPIAGIFLGLALFVALHPRYSAGYLTHTIRFIRTYARELAPIYILSARFSIWRDLIWDIWRQRQGGPRRTLQYAYGNGVLIMLLLNPASWIASAALLTGDLPKGSVIAYGGTVALAGLMAMILTGFRATRFLGEPERYVEATTPWAALAAGYVLWSRFGAVGLVVACALFLVIDVAQLRISALLLQHTSTYAEQLNKFVAVIEGRLSGHVRFGSNNEHFTKLLMQNDWQYAYCLAVGQDYCGMSVGEAFSTFPLLRREAFERIVTSYRLNACLLDRTVYEEMFVQRPARLREVTIAYESPRFRLLILDWGADE